MSGFIYDTGFEDLNIAIKRFKIDYTYNEKYNTYRIFVRPLYKCNNKEFSLNKFRSTSLSINGVDISLYDNIDDAIRDVLSIDVKRLPINNKVGDCYSYTIYVDDILLDSFTVTRKVLDDAIRFIVRLTTGDNFYIYKIDKHTYNSRNEVYNPINRGGDLCKTSKGKVVQVYYDSGIDIYTYKMDGEWEYA